MSPNPQRVVARYAQTKKDLPDQKVRKAYYEAGDGIQGLKEAARSALGGGDRKYNDLVKKLEAAHNALYKYLEATYNWD